MNIETHNLRTLPHIAPHLAQDRTAIIRVHNRGEFWKPCPGTGDGYLCCGYQILTPLTGCGMYCSYCVLQVYFEHQCQVAFENIADLESEVTQKMKTWKGVVRFGTGEFGDSLFAEPQLGLSRTIARILEPFPNALVEFKTKSTNIDSLSEIRSPNQVVIGFSMNTPAMVQSLERGTSSIEDRLVAARRCEEMGFSVAFHFDPMVWYDSWEQDYRMVVDEIYGAIRDPRRIAWCSMGGFRTMPALKTKLKGTDAYYRLFSGEMICGRDGKLRYFRPVRAAFYRAMREAFERHDPDAPVYLCMESPELWRDAGMIDRIPGGLCRYLDSRAEEILSRVC